jgi:serine/threonine protein phosphatase PrpC
MPALVRSWHLTDVGCVRDHNEDNGYADPLGRFFICSDGMGGHASGDVASRMAVDVISQQLGAWPPQLARVTEVQDGDSARDALRVIEAAVRAANDAIHRRGRNEPDKRGMGCTVDVTVIAGSLALCAHVGDSRNYLIRDGQTRQLTQDHSLAPPRYPGQPVQKGMLTSALGPNPTCRVDTFAVELRDGDRILMCTDGLADYYGDEREIGVTIVQRGDAAGAAWLLEQAKARGGADNITIVLAAIDRVQAPMPVAAPPPSANLRAVSYAAPTSPMTAAPEDMTSPMSPVPRPSPLSHSGAQQAISGSIVSAAAASMQIPPAPQIVPPGVTPPAKKEEKTPAPELPANRMGAFTTSPLFNGVSAQHIAQLVGSREPETLKQDISVPRQWNGADTAWLILEGEMRGLLLYPEALIAPQQGWSTRETPDETTQAMPISRADFAKFCQNEPAAAVKLLQNVARLLATEVKELQEKIDELT